MTTLTRLNSDMGDILLTNLNTPAQDCTITMPVISGKSAYDLAVENGYVGSLQDWLASLSGWKPVDSDFANYLEQHLQLSSLFIGVNSKIEANKVELDARIEERISEARAISTKLENEAQERIKEANELSKQLLDEAALRVSDVSKLRDDLQSEAYERALAMDQLADDILSEQVTRVNELKDLGDFIDSMDSKVNSNHTYLLEHYSTSSTTTSEIANKIDALKTTYIDPALNTKATVTAVEQVQTSITNINGELVTVGSKLDGVIAESGKNKQDIAAVWTDMKVRVEAESALSTRIDNVVATTYDHDARIVAETKARTDADSAMASDIRAITARVDTTEGKITSLEEVTTTTNSSLSQVSKKLDNLVTTVDGKASSQALSDVSSRVSNAEGTLTSQGQSISKLTNDLDTTNNAVNTKASADSVSALTNRVSETEGKVTSNSNALTALTNRVTTTEGDIAKKADASVLVNYYTKTKADEAIAGEISKFNSNLDIGGTNLWSLKNIVNYAGGGLNNSFPSYVNVFGYTMDMVNQGTNANLPGNKIAIDPTKPVIVSWYPVTDHTSHELFYTTRDKDGNIVVGQRYKNGAKDSSGRVVLTIPVSELSSTVAYLYLGLGTTVYTTYSIKNVQVEQGSKVTAWAPSYIDEQYQLNANATAISGLSTRVTNNEGNITSQGTSITNLQNSISAINGSLNTKADSSALSALDNKVTGIDGRTTANANSITSLQGSVETINGTLTTKANSSALNNYYTKQDSDSAIAGKISEFKANYVLPELGKKFDASAINAYYNKSDTDSAISSKIDSFKANYVDTELGKKFNASAINNYFNKAETNQAITSATTELNASLAKKVNNDDIPSIVDLSQTGKRHLVSTVGLDTEKYYPVCFNVNHKKSRITMSVSLGQSKASWATHGAGWSGHIEVTQRAGGWGSNNPDLTIEKFAYTHCAQSPVIRVGQIWQASKAIFYLRGGTEYFFYVDNNVGNPELYTSRQVFYEEYGVYCEPIAYDKSLEPKSFKTEIQNNASALTTLKAEVKEVDGKVVATASKLDNISTTVGNHTASIQQHSESINGIKTNWMLKLNSNGRVSGMTLMNDGSTSEFAIEADNFYVGAIDSAYKPFQVKTVGWTGVDGRSYPSGVYINNAVIGDLDAKVIRAGTITGDKIKAGSITADRIQIGSLGRDRLDTSLGSTVDTAYSTANSANNKINNLTVGGRNFWLNSKVMFSGNDDSSTINRTENYIEVTPVYNGGYIYVWLPTAIGSGEYTVSVDAEAARVELNLIISYIEKGGNKPWIVEGKKRCSVTVTRKDGEGGLLVVSVYNAPSVKLSNFKIEKGHVATDWTPAPEDVQNNINTVSSVAAGARDLLNRWKANGNGTLYIDDNHIAVNKIGANEIAAGAITTEKLAVGSSTNLWANPEFKDYGANKTVINNGYRTGIGGKNGWRFNGNAYGSDDTMFSVCANEEYLFDFIIGYHTGNCNIGFHLYNGSRGWIHQIMQPPVNYIDLGSGWYRASVSIKIPGYIGSSYFARVSFWANKDSAVTISDLIVTRKNSGQLIVDGTITGDKIRANTSITAPVINGGLISGSEININNMFKVSPTGELTAKSGTFEGIVKADKIEGTIDVKSLKSSAWMGGWRQQISFSTNFMPYLISGYNVYNFTWVYDSKSDLIPSFGGLNLNIGYKGFDIGGLRLIMYVWVNEDITVTQKLLIVDDQVTFHLNGTQFKSVTNGGRVNEDIVWNLVKGFNTLMVVIANSGWNQCSILLSGDIVDNNIVKFA